MDSHGGWIGTPNDLLRILLRVDGFADPADILSAATIADMTTPSAANPGYASGWAVNSSGTRWHDGTLVGTQSILVRVANQHEWAAVCNAGRPSTALGGELDALMWLPHYARCIKTVPFSRKKTGRWSSGAASLTTSPPSMSCLLRWLIHRVPAGR